MGWRGNKRENRKYFEMNESKTITYQKLWDAANLDGPGDYHTKWSKSDRERQMPYDNTYMQNLKKWYKWTYFQNRNRLTDLENKLGREG